ncbi:CYIR protein, partial [Plasmodium cynomolgi strain B]
FRKVCSNVKNYLNYVKVYSKSLVITKCFKPSNYLLYDHEINNLFFGCTTLPMYSDLQKLYGEKCFDLVICNEHIEDLKYV